MLTNLNDFRTLALRKAEGLFLKFCFATETLDWGGFAAAIFQTLVAVRWS